MSDETTKETTEDALSNEIPEANYTASIPRAHFTAARNLKPREPLNEPDALPDRP